MAKETGIPLRAEMTALVRSYGLDPTDVMSVDVRYDATEGATVRVVLVPTQAMVDAFVAAANQTGADEEG